MDTFKLSGRENKQRNFTKNYTPEQQARYNAKYSRNIEENNDMYTTPALKTKKELETQKVRLIIYSIIAIILGIIVYNWWVNLTAHIDHNFTVWNNLQDGGYNMIDRWIALNGYASADDLMNEINISQNWSNGYFLFMLICGITVFISCIRFLNINIKLKCKEFS